MLFSEQPALQKVDMLFRDLFCFDFGWDSFHEVLTITIKRMHAGRYMITCNDALKTDKSSALNLLGESVKSDHYIWEYLIEIQTKTNT